LDTILVSDQPEIIFEDIFKDLGVSWRRWSRIRKIRMALRVMRLRHPHIKFITNRQNQIISVKFNSEYDLLTFALIYPANFPKWHRVII
jgi:hypothetical protein